ncbi:hypothetical protein NMY22_g17277 [Coprinellus aureogranulatus]|nr:hypothetical protein NMY22_g17277 [Coprinellus aureogranulatus]
MTPHLLSNMPALELTVNVPIPDEQAFVAEFSKAASRILSKPEQHFLINVKHNPNLCFAGTLDPAFLLTVDILDTSNPESNAQSSKDFFALMKSKFNIEDTRGYIIYNDPGRSNWGWKIIASEHFPRPRKEVFAFVSQKCAVTRSSHHWRGGHAPPRPSISMVIRLHTWRVSTHKDSLGVPYPSSAEPGTTMHFKFSSIIALAANTAALTLASPVETTDIATCTYQATADGYPFLIYPRQLEDDWDEFVDSTYTAHTNQPKGPPYVIIAGYHLTKVNGPGKADVYTIVQKLGKDGVLKDNLIKDIEELLKGAIFKSTKTNQITWSVLSAHCV